MAIVSLSQTFVKHWAAINTADLLFSLMIKTVSKKMFLYNTAINYAVQILLRDSSLFLIRTKCLNG